MPSFGVATTINPLENSCLDGQGIRTHNCQLNVVITFDISGSMGGKFKTESNV